MSPEQRREAIVDAVLPLVREHGANVTTKQIAQAAGIAEGTVFRAFNDKTELLHACVAAALSPDELCAAVRAVPADTDLADRLAEAAQLTFEHFTRFGELVHTLAASGFDLRGSGAGPGPVKKPGPMPDLRARFVRDLNAAVTSLIDPREVRVPPAQLANYLQSLTMGIRFNAVEPENPDFDEKAEIRARIEVLLHGALADITDTPGETR